MGRLDWQKRFHNYFSLTIRKINTQKKEPTHKEVKGVGLISCDDITQTSRQNKICTFHYS
jgi:hypothetical protein